ncbi:MAG: DNA repair protein RadA [Anaerolineales bacterium]|nr:DNA repair protein RadA [Anaerolineales bacterium]
MSFGSLIPAKTQPSLPGGALYNTPMAKSYSRYVCQECGHTNPRYMGRCPGCGEWETMVEEIVERDRKKGSSRSASREGASTKPIPITKISSGDEDRISLSTQEFSRVLGGGLVPGSINLIGGDPGIGKSTLLLQIAMDLAEKGKVLYVSGEESERQIKMRASRIKQNAQGNSLPLPANLYLLTETDVDYILDHAQSIKPILLIVDSIQTSSISELDSSAGSVTQVRESSSRFREFAKRSGTSVFLIGHVTKKGTIAGPRVLEHIVDTVLYLEGDRYQAYRLLRSVKNRYGATSEVGVFEMRERGMIEINNPSEAFLAERMVNAPGSAIAVTMEGTRPILVEIQGLTNPTSFGNPRRTPNGIEFNRLLLITAVLSRRTGINLSEQDVFVNVVGGLKISEPAADLAVAVAVASSVQDQPVRADTILVGEIGLSGELRMASRTSERIHEAAKLGFQTAIVPRRLREGGLSWPEGIEVIECRSLRQALDQALTSKRS